jgi:ubiquinone/menaquinone biosynthesis C-methylase UbiE
MSAKKNLKAKFIIPTDTPIKELTEERPWENYWERNASVPTTFLRNSKAIHHPSRTLIADLCAKIGGSVLECGSATAIDYPLYLERGLDYHAIDITPKFVKQAKELYPELDIREANVLKLPFDDGKIDTVYCRAMLEHMHPEEWPHGVVEMWRVADKQMIIGLYLRPNMQTYNGPILPPPPTKKRGAYTNRRNQDHLLKLCAILPNAGPVERIITEKVDGHRMNWVYVVPKAKTDIDQLPFNESE